MANNKSEIKISKWKNGRMTINASKKANGKKSE